MGSFTERSAKTNLALSDSARWLSEERLIEAAKGGHSAAFATLSERYRQRLFRAAHRIARNSEDAEDAVQDSLLRAFVHVKDFDGRSKLETWLTRIAINSALMILRKKRASHEVATDGNDDFGEDGLPDELAGHWPNPESRYARREEASLLRRAIQSLRPNLRVVVQIHLQERSMRETAKATGISLVAAKGRLFHAKNALRKSLIRKLVRQPRFASGICVLPAGRWLAQSQRTNTLRQLTAIQ